MKRKAFNFYNSHWEQIKLLNKKQQLELFISICQVQFLEINIEDIEFDDNISTLVWTGIKHSLATSMKGFVSKQKGLSKIVDTPLAKGLTKGGADPPCQEEEEKGEEEEEGKEKEKPTNEFLQEKEILNSVYNLFDFEIISSLTEIQKNDWLDTINKLHRIDKYEYLEIENTIIWGRQDHFWKSNFLSILGLRKKKDGISKFFQINKKMNHERTGKNGQSTKQDDFEDFSRHLAKNLAEDPDLV